MDKRQYLIDLILRATDLNRRMASAFKVNLDSIDNLAERYTKKSSEFLIAVLGGILGIVSVAVLRIYIEISAIFYSMGIGFGVILAILLWRGRGQHKIEKTINRHNLIISKILADIENLPEDVPDEIVWQYWDIYTGANNAYSKSTTTRVGT